MVAYLHQAAGRHDAQQSCYGGRRHRHIDPEPQNMYRAEIEEFSQALLDDRPNPLDAQHGLRSQQTLAACYEISAVRARP